jgi:hypothetical protein
VRGAGGASEPLTCDEFAARITAWRRWMFRDGDDHAIRRQVVQMWRDHADFLVLRLIAYRLGRSGRSGALANPLLLDMLRSGYAALALLAIRRLTDPNESEQTRETKRKKQTKDRENKRSVISLKRIIDELEDNASTISREVFVTWDGTPYDPAAMLAEADRRLSEKASMPGKIQAYAGWGDSGGQGLSGFEASLRRHEIFDLLAGVPPGKRTSDDRIKLDVICVLRGMLKASEIEHIRTVASKKIAHADESRSTDDYVEGWDRVFLSQLRRAHTSLTALASFLATDILEEGVQFTSGATQRGLLGLLNTSGLTAAEAAFLRRVPDLVRTRFTRDQQRGREAIRRQMRELAACPGGVARAPSLPSKYS